MCLCRAQSIDASLDSIGRGKPKAAPPIAGAKASTLARGSVPSFATPTTSRRGSAGTTASKGVGIINLCGTWNYMHECWLMYLHHRPEGLCPASCSTVYKTRTCIECAHDCAEMLVYHFVLSHHSVLRYTPLLFFLFLLQLSGSLTNIFGRLSLKKEPRKVKVL